ncbi:probable ATP-dependent RNA helicase DDX49 isoform X1 [Mustela lutreola]|uniref:Probable ATP-dependent RNA helicase DDX49 n=2 Tax=Mustelinae TaxID=169418 RepID=A0A8U0NXP8_MUSPF|nr:probable ATP-dependent RNA helicase DDX49 isoform X1 [Mustela putorius furo]XP_059016560.1 probable ATP-dependent RNA helicase DDX49 isoform X1 [Mustela lutreola]
MAGFAELGLSSWLVEQCRQLGLKQPTPVQLGCIPAILEGRDCLGCAKTGSGKTAAFVLPILQKLSEDPYGIFCLVLTPTRELAYQIAEQFRVLGKPLGLKDCIIVGGMDMVAQALELSRKPHVVIATPGRLADHLRSSNTFSIKKIRFLVMDEADRLLEQGCTDFTVDLEAILAAVPARRQTLLFSATLTDTLRELQGLATNQPFFWEAQAPVRTVEQLDQRYLLVPEKVKDAYLVHLIQNFQDEHEDWSIIIFTNTCKTCQILCMMLRKFNFPTVALHSMMKQKERFAALAKFKSSIYRILIATDVASRGLDIPTVQVVINHNTPGLPKIYIHRVGRTARAGRQGQAITLVTQYDIHLVHAIEEQIRTPAPAEKKLEEFSVEEASVLQILTQVNVVRRECEIKLEAANFDEKKEINKRKQLILEGKDPDLEAKRKAELAKIKQKNRRFKDKVEQVLQRQKARGAGRRGRPPRAPPGAQSAPAPSQGPS